MNEKLLEDFKSDDIHIIQCEHKWCDAYGYEKSQMKKDILDSITNLQQENEKLKYNARGQVNDYFKDKYADEVLKNVELQQDLNKANDIIEKDRQFYKRRMDEYAELKKENETLKAKLEIGKTCGFCPYYDYKQRNEKTIEYINKQKKKMYKSRNKIALFILMKLENILNGSVEK